MPWNAEKQTQFDALRARERAGPLTAQEAAALAELVATLEVDEARRYASAVDRMRAEQAALREQLGKVQTENEALAKLLNQQEQLVTDARRWLAQFEQRHRLIQQAYTHLTGEVLPSAASSR